MTRDYAIEFAYAGNDQQLLARLLALVERESRRVNARARVHDTEIIEWDLVEIDDGVWDWTFSLRGSGKLPTKADIRYALTHR